MVVSVLNFLKTAQLARLVRRVNAMRLIRRALGLAEAPAARHQPALAPVAAPVPALRQAEPLEAAVSPQPTQPGGPARFTEDVFAFGDEAYAYRLYRPAMAAGAAGPPALLPVVVLLHGCKQDAADFAQGTAMNALADEKKCIVLYPEQLAKANPMRCWNWFEPAHQTRDAGEPAMIAALTRQVIERHDADPARVYIAGLSAGGAMAALVAGLYPELFAALGVHSGVPTGAADDVMSAFGAMRRGAPKGTPEDGTGGALPTIVFHGGADKTVHPDNGDQIADAALAGLGAAGMALEKIQPTEESAASTGERRNALRTIYGTADGTPWVEHWAVESGPHAWSGGSAAGSFTDPLGPDASRAMLEFFLQHHK